MNLFSCTAARRRALVLIAGALFTVSSTGAASAQGFKDRIVDDVANQLVAAIQSDNCAQFEAMLKKKKGGGGSRKGGGMMKNDPAARARFVNKVAGPLVNKMIDCDLLPGR